MAYASDAVLLCRYGAIDRHCIGQAETKMFTPGNTLLILKSYIELRIAVERSGPEVKAVSASQRHVDNEMETLSLVLISKVVCGRPDDVISKVQQGNCSLSVTYPDVDAEVRVIFLGRSTHPRRFQTATQALLKERL